MCGYTYVYYTIIYHTQILQYAACMLILGNLVWTGTFFDSLTYLPPGLFIMSRSASLRPWQTDPSEQMRNWKSQGNQLLFGWIINESVKKSVDSQCFGALMFFQSFPKHAHVDSKKQNHQNPRTLPVMILLIIFKTAMTLLPWFLEGCLRSCSLRKPAVMIPAGSAKSPMPPKQGTLVELAAIDEETSKSHQKATRFQFLLWWMDSCNQLMTWILTEG